jgi:cardiolipin synthase
MIALGALLWRVLVGPIQPQPSLLSKACTLAQILYLLNVLLGRAGWPVPPPMPLAWLVAALCAASWLDYALRWSWRARRARRAR